MRLISLPHSLTRAILAALAVAIVLSLVPQVAEAAPKKVMLKFSATSYSVAENTGTFNVTVLRTGNTRAAATVQYSDNGTGTATEGLCRLY